jgi:hypothetical protein
MSCKYRSLDTPSETRIAEVFEEEAVDPPSSECGVAGGFPVRSLLPAAKAAQCKDLLKVKLSQR